MRLNQKRVARFVQFVARDNGRRLQALSFVVEFVARRFQPVQNLLSHLSQQFRFFLQHLCCGGGAFDGFVGGFLRFVVALAQVFARRFQFKADA